MPVSVKSLKNVVPNRLTCRVKTSVLEILLELFVKKIKIPTLSSLVKYGLWGLLLGHSCFARAQELPNTIHFSKEQYQAQSQNWDICTLPEGGVFIANNGGLLEYDGARWYRYQLPEGQVVRAVGYMDGKVFAGGFAAFGYFEPDEKRKWRYVSLSKALASEAIRSEEIWHILPHPSSGNVFFQSFSTIFRFDGRQVEQLRPPSNIMFLEDVNGRIVFQGIGTGLYELLKGGGFRFLEGSETLAQSIVTFILPKGKDTLLVGTRNEGLFTVQNKSCHPWSSQFNERLRKTQPNKAVILPGGQMCIGTIREGVFVFNSADDLLFHLESPNGLQNNTVLALEAGLNGELWVGLDRGLDCVELNLPLLRFADWTGELGTAYAASLRNGKLYLGTNQGLFVKNWPDPHARFQLIDGTQGQVWSLYDAPGGLLCGHNEGTFRVSGLNVERISTVTGGWTFAALASHPDMLLQGTYTGLVAFARQRGTWSFSHRVAGFQQPVRHLFMDDSGYWWAAHPSRGLWRLRLSDDLSKVIEIKRFAKANGLKADFNVRMYRCAEGLFLTEGGRVYKVSAGRILETDDTPDIGPKICLPNGLSVYAASGNVEIRTQELRKRYPLSLVPGYETVLLLKDSLLLFCLEDGYALLPLDALQNTLPPKGTLRMAAVEILGNPLRVYYPTGKDTLWQTSSNRNNLRLLLATPGRPYAGPFEWRLAGPVVQTFTTEKPEAELTGLAPGLYTLSVFCEGKEGLREFRFEVLPPWWQQGWALLIWALTAGLLIALVEKIYRTRLRRHQRKMQIEKERELAAERLEAERERLAAEVQNKTRELSSATLNLIRKNETLTALLEELKSMDMDSRSRFRLRKLIEGHLSADEDWQTYEQAFNQVHDAFFTKMKQKHPQLTPGDLRLASLLRLNLSSKEIASLLGISVRGVENKRYRLRKKLGLPPESNLTEYIIGFQ